MHFDPLILSNHFGTYLSNLKKTKFKELFGCEWVYQFKFGLNLIASYILMSCRHPHIPILHWSYHCMLSDTHCTLYTVHCTLNTIHYIVQFKARCTFTLQYTVQCKKKFFFLYSVEQSVPYNICRVLYSYVSSNLCTRDKRKLFFRD